MRLVIATASFDATHRDSTEGPRLHGHRFTVRVTASVPENATLDRSLSDDLGKIVKEIHLRDLGEMLNRHEQAMDGLAAWFMERLALAHPTIIRSEIDDGLGYAVAITREPR